MGRENPFDGYETGPKDATASVIWLHGLGADGYDFAPIVPELRLPPALKVRFVFPHAPHRPVTLNGGALMRAWYDIRSLDLEDRSHDQDGVRAARELVTGLIDRECDRGVAPDHIVVAGFSQGGAVATHVAVRHPHRLAAAVALSSYLLNPERLADEKSPANDGLPFFVAHGDADPIVPIAAGQHARDQLREAGYSVEWRTYTAPHGVHPQEILDVGRFLAAHL